MRKNLGAMTAVYPMPVFIIGSYDENGIPDAMNAAWGGISEDKEISICVSAEHKTTENILKSGAFTVSMATRKYVAECDYVGIVSGNDVPNKLDKCGFHTEKSEYVNAPIIEELPMCLECRLKSYDKDTCRLVGEIVSISADESILTDGKIDVKKLEPITYDPVCHLYYVLGEKVGNAFRDGDKLKS